MLDAAARIIQVALTPVFLLSAIGSLLSVFSLRLGRVSDQVDAVAVQLLDCGPSERVRLTAQLDHLRRRSLVLDVAVVLAAIGGGFTCAAALVLFVGALTDGTVVSMLFGFFGAAIACTMAAIAFFVTELLLAGRGLRERVAARQDEAEEAEAGRAG